jgi:hypothetical protein
MADLRVDIAAEFVGKKAFKEADTAAGKLDKTIKKLGRTLGVTLGASAIVAYSKASVKAFADDEAAARRLSSAVDNLGLSFSKVQVATFISDLERTASIADDVLRPAFQSLLNITGSLTKSQELLNNAIQISRASGVDLATVTNDLGKGYVGVTRGLMKYNTGLSRAELQTKSFNEILGIMLAKSAGAAQDYLTTTSFKMDTLALASENAKETIGEGLVEAFARIGGGTEAKDAAKAIDNIAKAVNAVTLTLGTAIGLVNKFRQGYTNFLMDPLGTGMGSGAAASTNRSASPAGTARRTAQQRQAEAAAVKRAKELASLTKKQVDSQKKLLAEQKKQDALKRAGSIFDLEQVQLIAALKGKLSDEDRKRVELQFALITGNTKQAQQLTYEIAKAQGLGEQLASYLATLPDAKNPFASWDAYLDMLEAKAKRVANTTAAVTTAGATVAAAAAVSDVVNKYNVSDPSLEPYGQSLVKNNVFDRAPSMPSTNVASVPSTGNLSQFGAGPYLFPSSQQSNIVVQIDGKAVASALQDSSLSGIGSSVNRTGR